MLNGQVVSLLAQSNQQSGTPPADLLEENRRLREQLKQAGAGAGVTEMSDASHQAPANGGAHHNVRELRQRIMDLTEELDNTNLVGKSEGREGGGGER